MRWFALLALVGCYAPTVKPGSPCTSSPCPAPLVCAADFTCQLAGDAGATVDVFPLPDEMLFPDAPDASLAPANDEPANAQGIGMNGGDVTGDLTHATATFDRTCYGGADVFFQINLTAPSVVELDTLGAGFDTALIVYAGKACDALTQATTPDACADDDCDTVESVVALQLPAGKSCITVAEADSHMTGGPFTLHVRNQHRTGIGAAYEPFVGTTTTVTGDTCSSTVLAKQTCESDAAIAAGSKAVNYFFPLCPGAQQISARDCDVTWDSVIYVLDSSGNQVACNDDSQAADCHPNTNPSEVDNVPLTGPGVGWLGVGGYDTSDCGTYNFAIRAQ